MSQPKLYRGVEIRAAPPGEYVCKGFQRWGCSLTRKEILRNMKRLPKYNKIRYYGPLPRI